MAQKLLLTLAGMLTIVLFAGILAYAFPGDSANYVEPTIFSWPTAAPLPTSTPVPVALQDVKAKLDRGDKVVLLDARSPANYNAGHIKGAISLPAQDFNDRYDAVRNLLPADAELITYCDGSS